MRMRIMPTNTRLCPSPPRSSAPSPTQDSGGWDTHLLRDATDTSISNDADREPGREAGEADREAGAELDEARVERHGRLEVARDEDRDDEAVDLCKVGDGARVSVAARLDWTGLDGGGERAARMLAGPCSLASRQQGTALRRPALATSCVARALATSARRSALGHQSGDPACPRPPSPRAPPPALPTHDTDCRVGEEEHVRR